MAALAGTYLASDICRMALKDSGVLAAAQPAQAEDLNDAFTKLNWMLSEWQRERWLVYHLVSTGFVADGSLSFSVGLGGQYPISPRPDRIESAFVRQLAPAPVYLTGDVSNFVLLADGTTGIPIVINPAGSGQIDYPLELIQSYEDYSRIGLKSLYSFPRMVFYDPGYPTGTLYPWPVPTPGLYEVFIQTKEILSQFASLTSPVALPAEYLSALHWNLVCRIAPGYGEEPSRTAVALAKRTLNVLRKANSAVARLQMPRELVKPGTYNPYSDQT